VRDALGSIQSALVLGGSSEIAAATVRALAKRRALRVVLAARKPDRVAPLARAVEAAGGQAEAVRFDADDLESHEGFVEQVFDRHGDIDLVLVAFGVLGDSRRSAVDGAAAAAVVRTNFLGAASVLVAVARRLREQGHGTIVVLSSTGVQVIVVRPGFVRTKMTAGLEPAPLATSPDAVAEAILGGLARGAHTVWVPSSLRLVMAVARHLPRAVFRRLEV
jgi:decaprenylphospho-beta-D-erythro-pentofuranosid-2-ulose 2-reductase